MNYKEAFDEFRWRIEGCIIGLWFWPLFHKSKSYPIRSTIEFQRDPDGFHPVISRIQLLLIHLLYITDITDKNVRKAEF